MSGTLRNQCRRCLNFELNRLGKKGADLEGGEIPANWVDEHPDELKMSRAQFNTILEKNS